MFNKLFLCFFLLVFVSSSLQYLELDRVWVEGSVDSRAWNINTGLEYRTIQAAIDARETLDGHTIFVEAGEYYEHVTVNKSLSLVGENQSSTMIDGSLTGNAIVVDADHVNVTGFTVRKASCSIYLTQAAFGNITHNTIADAIVSNMSNNNVISDNLFLGMSGLILQNSCDNMVSNNAFQNVDSTPLGGLGIYIVNSSRNEVYGNRVLNRTIGLMLQSSGDNRLHDNNITGNFCNFWMTGSSVSDFNNSIDRTNLVDGKNICCLHGASNAILDSRFDLATVYLVRCENVTVKDLDLTGNGCGMFLWETNDVRVENATVTNNFIGLELENCENVTVNRCDITENRNGVHLNLTVSCEICLNDISRNDGFGVMLENSFHASIHNDNITENREGVSIDHGSSNSIFGNLIERNSNGVRMIAAYDNVFYHNSFVQNRVQVESPDLSYCTWDKGSEGNYWTDYTGIDANHDGIGDTPYILHWGWENTDHYPLVTAYTYWGNPILGDVDRDMKVDLIDIASAASHLGSCAGDLKWNPRADLTGSTCYLPDGVIDLRDLVVIAKSLGKRCK